MNKTAYISLLKNEKNGVGIETPNIDELIESFPYHATSYILMAKSADQNGSMFASKKLKQASFFSPNRGHLRKLFQNGVDSQKVSKLVLEQSFVLETETKSIAFLDNQTAKELDTVDFNTIEIPNQLVEKNPFTEINKNSSILKYYVHTTDFGNSPKTVKENLLTEFLAYRGEIVFENAPIGFQLDIIKKFLEEEPKISRFESQAIEPTKSDLSRRSTTEDNDLITENMANIFVKQNKYKRAIEVYQKLMLKYPEKETYFAEKIISLQYQI